MMKRREFGGVAWCAPGWLPRVPSRWLAVTVVVAGVVGASPFVVGDLSLGGGAPVLVASYLLLAGLIGVRLRALQLEGAALNLHALHLTHLERWEQAGEALDEALGRHLLDRATRSNVLLNRAIVFTRQGEASEGLSLLLELGERPRVLLEVALAQALLGQLEAAQATMERLGARGEAPAHVDLRILVRALLSARLGQDDPGELSDEELARVSENQFMRRTMLLLMDFRADALGDAVEWAPWKALHARRLAWLGASWPELAAFLSGLVRRGEGQA